MAGLRVVSCGGRVVVLFDLSHDAQDTHFGTSPPARLWPGSCGSNSRRAGGDLPQGGPLMAVDNFDMIRGVYRRQYSGFITGKRICSVTMSAEAWFWRLHALADDWGRLESDPDLIVSTAAGRRKITQSQSEGWIKELADANLIRVYFVRDTRFLEITDFTATQPMPRTGHRVRRVPGPDDEGASERLTALDNASERTNALSRGSGSDDGDSSGKGECRGGILDVTEPIPKELDTPEFREAWGEWLAYRIEKRKPVTPRSARMSFKTLMDMGPPRAVAAIQHSIGNGYQGIFEGNQNGTAKRPVDDWRARKAAREFPEDIKVRIDR